jgi:hypothetical protein
VFGSLVGGSVSRQVCAVLSKGCRFGSSVGGLIIYSGVKFQWSLVLRLVVRADGWKGSSDSSEAETFSVGRFKEQ